MKLLVTRPAAQAAEWVRRLHAAGVDAVAVPLIAIVPAPDPAAVVAAWQRLASYRLLVFVSANAAEQFMALRPAGTPWPAGTRAGSTGPGTSRALLALGLPHDRLVEPAADAAQFDSEALWARLEGEDWQAARVLIVRGDGGRDWLGDTLRGRGASVEPLAAYRRQAPGFGPAERAAIDAARAEPARHVWFFSSSEAIDHLVATWPDAAWSRARAIATHPRIAERARRAGFGEVTPSRPELPAVVACLQSLLPADGPRAPEP